MLNKISKPKEEKKTAPLYDHKAVNALMKELAQIKAEQAAFNSKYAKAMEHLKALQDQEAAKLGELKRLVAVSPEPPPSLDPKQRTVVLDSCGGYVAKITYVRASSYYDPALLPPNILLKPGVVKTVNTDRITSLPAKQLELCAKALREGAWGTPRVTYEEDKGDK